MGISTRLMRRAIAPVMQQRQMAGGGTIAPVVPQPAMPQTTPVQAVPPQTVPGIQQAVQDRRQQIMGQIMKGPRY